MIGDMSCGRDNVEGERFGDWDMEMGGDESAGWYCRWIFGVRVMLEGYNSGIFFFRSSQTVIFKNHHHHSPLPPFTAHILHQRLACLGFAPPPTAPSHHSYNPLANPIIHKVG